MPREVKGQGLQRYLAKWAYHKVLRLLVSFLLHALIQEELREINCVI